MRYKFFNNRVLFISLTITLVLLFSNLISAEFTLGNSSYEVQEVYGTSKPIKGWINLSLESEPSDSLLTAFESSITLVDFLENNSISYECFPLDCSSTYSKKTQELSSGNFTLFQGQKKLIGVEIIGNVDKVNNLAFNIKTSSQESCSIPLKVDVLKDNLIEWKYIETTQENCNSEEPFGCFQKPQGLINVSNTNYCEEITIPPTKAVRLGAILEGQGTAGFVLSIDGEPCSSLINKSGEISCIVEFDEPLSISTTAEICLRAEAGSEDKYKIGYEDDEPICGYRGTEDDKKFYDFNIFAKPQMYSEIKETISFNKQLIGEDEATTLNNNILDYIDSKYDNNCTEGCIIPINFLTGANQNLFISNLSLEYEVTDDLQPKFITKFYELENTPALITTDLKKLDLEKANLLTPSTTGTKELILKLNNEKLFEKEINIKNIPEILAILPSNPPALVSTTFVVIMENKDSNLTYTWDFGDNNLEQTTSSNLIKHTYTKIGSYTLKLTIKGSFGESTQLFNINAIAPSDAINQTIIEYKENLKELKRTINNLPIAVRNEIEKVIDVDSLEKSVLKKEEEYKESFTDEEFIKVMTELLSLNIPQSLGKGLVIKPTDFFQSQEQIRLDDLVFLDIGEVDLEKGVSEYYNAMNNWIIENIDASFELETYMFNYKNQPSEPILTQVKLSLIPKKDIEELYILINGNPAKIKISTDLNDKDIEETSKVIILKELIDGETREIEFIYPGKVDLDTLPFYLTPELDNLDLSFTPDACNNNGKCESGETTKNCRNDCKPWKLAFFYLLILLIITFIVYIILQEWYKRKYEDHLFKDKNQLFNLINFIQITENQGFNKDRVFSQLQKRGWKKEQLIYAWKKYKGQRTGMWEIPIFKVFEKIKLKKELKKRKSVQGTPLPQNNNLVRKPPIDNRKVNKEKMNPNYKRP